MNEFKHLLMVAPESQLDPAAKELIKKWSEPAKAIEVLEVIDACIHGALASDATIVILQILYDVSCRDQNTTHEEVVKLAVWRNEDL